MIVRVNYTTHFTWNSWDPQLHEVLDILAPVMVKYVENNLNITRPRFSEDIFPVPWPFKVPMHVF